MFCLDIFTRFRFSFNYHVVGELEENKLERKIYFHLITCFHQHKHDKKFLICNFIDFSLLKRKFNNFCNYLPSCHESFVK